MEVLDVRLERNADGVPLIEGVAHQQVLGLRIHYAAPLVWRVPRPADLDRPIVFLHIEVTGAADHLGIAQANDSEWILSALRLREQGFLDPGVHRLRRSWPGRHPLPDLLRAAGLQDRKSTRLNSSHMSI